MLDIAAFLNRPQRDAILIREAAISLDRPATATPTLSARMSPRDVRTPTTRCPFLMKPVTAHCWMMSTPSAEAARAYPHATASCRAAKR